MSKKQISNMGQRAYANVTALIGSTESLRKSVGHVQDSQGKWRDSTGRLTEGLSKFQIQIGATIDDQGRVKDAQDRIIDGMRDTDIALGRYIDSQGRLRDSQDRIIEGLNAQQKAAGMYKDELGNLYDAQDKVIKSAETLEKVKGVTLKQTISATKGLGQLTATMTAYTGTTNPAAKASVALAAGLQAGTAAMGAVAGITKVVSALRAVEIGRLWTQFTAQQALNGATGNFVGIAAGIAAGAGAAAVAYAAMGKEADDAATKIGKLDDNFLSKITDRYKSNLDRIRDKEKELEEEIKELKKFINDSKKSYVERGEARKQLVNVEKDLRAIRLEEQRERSGYYEQKKKREETEKWIDDQLKKSWTESQRIGEDLNRAQEALVERTKEAVRTVNFGGDFKKQHEEAVEQKKKAAEVVKRLQKQYGDTVEQEMKAAKALRFGGLEDVVKKANDAAMTLAEKEAELAKARDEQIDKLKELLGSKDITGQELANAKKYLADEMKKQVDALNASPWDQDFKKMFEMRVPLEDRVKEAFDKIKKAGDHMLATDAEIRKMQAKERERLEKLYDTEKMIQKEKEKSGHGGGSFVVAGSVEAYQISMASSQEKTTKAIERMDKNLVAKLIEIDRNQKELNNKLEVA